MLDSQTVSVAICTYNGSDYILEQLNSISNQTVLPDEIVICDDCSNDDTISKLMKFKEKSKLKIRIYYNDNQLGFRKNYQKCIGLCNCDIVFYCDQDDVWLENKIERIICEFTNNVVFVFSDGFVTDDKLNIVLDSEWDSEWNKYNKQEYFDYVQTRKFPLGHLQAFRRDMVQKITPFLSDPDGWIAQCAPAFGDVVAIPDKLLYYRRHGNTVSNAFNNKKRSAFEYFKRMLSLSFQEYFTWPLAEAKTYGKILEYIHNNSCKINDEKLVEHLSYLNSINMIEKERFFKREKLLNNLYKSNIYQKYRGNKNTFLTDKIYLLINSFTKN